MKLDYHTEMRRRDDWVDYLEWQEQHVLLEAKEAVCRF